MFLNFILPKLSIERWKWNDEHGVFVSTEGRFKDAFHRDIQLKTNSSGYVLVKTQMGMMLAHRIVLFTFKPTMRVAKLTVDHIDHNKRNNRLSNLEWVSEKENRERAERDFIAAAPVSQPSSTPKATTASVGAIIAGSRTFNNLDEAIDFVINANPNAYKNDPSANPPSREKIGKRIINAINQNKLYMDRKWKLK